MYLLRPLQFSTANVGITFNWIAENDKIKVAIQTYSFVELQKKKLFRYGLNVYVYCYCFIFFPNYQE